MASAYLIYLNIRKKSILATLKTEGIYGFRDGGYKTDYEGNAEYSMEAVINALTNGKDYSNGAIRWDGFDLAARGFNHPKPKTAGVEISPADFMHFKAAWPAKLIKAYSAGKYTSFSSNSIQEVILQHMVRIKDMYYIHLRLLMVGLCFGRPI